MRARPFFRNLFAAAAALVWLTGGARADAAAGECPASDPAPEVPATSAAAPRPPSLPRAVGRALWAEVKLYGADTAALVVAPAHWNAADRWRAGAAAAAIGGSFAADRAIYDAFARNRSRFTNRVSGATSWFGDGATLAMSAGLIAGGLIAGSDEVRDTGRDALEATILTGVFTNYVIKPSFGRFRPEDTDGDTRFDPFSSHHAFTSGHATNAFAFASVVAMRAPGWIIPTVVYGIATVVALDRINDRAHFASDVVAGALFATATGRFLVRRHRDVSASEPPPKRAAFALVPIPDGLALRARW